MSDGFVQAQQTALTKAGVDAVSRFVPVDVVGGRAHVLVAGDGPALLLVNGIGLPAAMWAPLLARLDGFTLCAVDMPGFGLTASPPGFATDLRANSVRFINEVAEGLGLQRPLTLIGNSLGSLWSSWFALDRRDDVNALVHIGCPALVLETSAPLPMRLLSMPVLSNLLTKLQPPSTRQVERLSSMVGEDLAADHVMRDLLLAAERLPDHQRTLLSFLRVLVRPGGARMPLRREELERIDRPVQLIWGTGDPFGSVDIAEAACRALPNAGLEIVPGGHAPWLRYSDEIARVALPFLTRHVYAPAT